MKSLFSFACGLIAGILLCSLIVKGHVILGGIVCFVFFIIAQAISHLMHVIMKTRYENSLSYYDRTKW